MNKEQAKEKVAQPADEEIKKHGDLLEKQVREVAAKPSHESRNDSGDGGKTPQQDKD